MRGVWVVYATDWSSITCFSSEIDALHYNVQHSELKIGFVAFGDTFGGKVAPVVPEKKSRRSSAS